MVDPSNEQLAIDFCEPTVEQLPFQFDVSDPGSAYSNELKAAFAEPGPWKERRAFILERLQSAEREIAPRISPRLRYFRARCEELDDPQAAPDRVVARWTTVNETWIAQLGVPSGDACAHIGTAFVEMGEGARAVPYLDTALRSFETAASAGRRDERSERADRQWVYDVRRHRCRALLAADDPALGAEGVVSLLALEVEHERLARGSRSPADEAYSFVDRVLSGADALAFSNALIEALAKRCTCGGLEFKAAVVARGHAETILAEVARRLIGDDPRTAFELARALWNREGERYGELLAATVKHAGVEAQRGARFSASVSIAKADAAFREARYADALACLNEIERDAPEESFRTAYWRGMCLRNLQHWNEASTEFGIANGSPDGLLRAWAMFRSVQCALRIATVDAFFDRDPRTLEPYVDMLHACHRAAPNSRRMAFAAACALIAVGRPKEALAALDSVDASFRFYRAAQWLRCLCTLRMQPVDWRAAARELSAIENEPRWRLPIARAHEILAVCEPAPSESLAIVRGLFGESLYEDADEEWASILFSAIFVKEFADKALLRALDAAFDRALRDEARMATIKELAEARCAVAKELTPQRAVATALDVARTMAALGEPQAAAVAARLVLSVPAAATLGASREAASLLHEFGEAEDAGAEAAPHESSAALPGRGRRIALFGGHSRQRTACIGELERLGFERSDIEWKTADEGHRLSFSDCEPLLKGAFDYFVVVTSAIGHATSYPIVAYLRSNRKTWWPLAVAGHESFRTRIQGLFATASGPERL